MEKNFFFKILTSGKNGGGKISEFSCEKKIGKNFIFCSGKKKKIFFKKNFFPASGIYVVEISTDR